MSITTKFLSFIAMTFCVLVTSMQVNANTSTFTTLDAKEISLNLNTISEPTVFVVWASWCRYCMAEIPAIKSLYQKHPNIRWIGVNVNKSPEDGLEVQQRKILPYPSISDPNLVVSDHFKIRGTPGFIIFDASGKESYRGRRINDAFTHALSIAVNKPI